MPNIELPEDAVAKRGQMVRKLLAPISRHKDGPAFRVRPQHRKLVISAYDGTLPVSDYEKWRFSTFVSNYRAMYYERWIQSSSKANLMYLERAYLHICRFDKFSAQDEDEEILCLHCDPNESDQAPHAKYKQGPHLHLVASEQPFPHSHIALSLVNLSDVLTSMDKLNSVLYISIEMIRDQFLEPISRQ